MGIRRRAGAAILALLVVAGACSDDRPTGAPTTVVPSSTLAPAADIGVTLEQYRSDEVQHIIGVQVTNRGAGPIDIHSVQLDWPGLAPVAPSVVDYSVSPGAPVDLRVDYGDAICSDPPQLVEATPTDPIWVSAVTAGGEPQRWPVDDARGILPRVHGLDCRRQALQHLVEYELGRTWVPSAAGDSVAGELILTRATAVGTVALTGISGSVLIDIDLTDGAPTELTGDRLAIPVVVTSSGLCTGHALADSKKTYDFQITLDVQGAEASVSVSPDPADQPILFRPVEVTCGLD